MIIYKIIHTDIGAHGYLEEFCTEFESFRQAYYWSTELIKQKLPNRWKFEFIDAPKQYEFNF